MTGKPQREFPKRPIQVHVDAMVYLSISGFLEITDTVFSSMSQFVETVIFLSEQMYINEKEDGFLIEIARLKAGRSIAQIRERSAQRRRMHMTMDIHAIAFIDMLVKRYPMLFRDRSETVELLVVNAGRGYETRDGAHHLGSRLHDVLELYPSRKGSA